MFRRFFISNSLFSSLLAHNASEDSNLCNAWSLYSVACYAFWCASFSSLCRPSIIWSFWNNLPSNSLSVDYCFLSGTEAIGLKLISAILSLLGLKFSSKRGIPSSIFSLGTYISIALWYSWKSQIGLAPLLTYWVCLKDTSVRCVKPYSTFIWFISPMKLSVKSNSCKADS